ncbi:MAG: hypothetical protein JNL17_10265 [Cyclobacteriaceae bacterium]|nr:hypothetical protein [Cyclobacteriaceae bacterium]
MFRLLIAVLLISGVCSAQNQAGFFFVLNSKKNCPQKVSSISGRQQYCIASEPIIRASEFESVSDLKKDERQHTYLELTLSEVGVANLRTLSARLPDSQLVLVVDDKVVGEFENLGRIVNRTIPISDKNNSGQMTWIRDRLKAAITN